MIGARRASFSNEAGIGTAPIIHASSETKEPIQEGLVSMIGPFIDTIIVCTLTAVCILVTDSWSNYNYAGIEIVAKAFSNSMPLIGPYILLISTLSFAISTLFSLSFFGEKLKKNFNIFIKNIQVKFLDIIIIFVSSRAGVEGFDNESAYCAAKHGLEGLMKSLSIEGSSIGIQVFTITPGMFMNTPMSEQNYTDEYKKKWVDPIELTPAFLKLASGNYKHLIGKHINAWDLSNKDKK